MQRLIYGRRKGHRLRPGRERRLTEQLPDLQIQLPETGSLDPRACFAGAPARVWLEIGFGGGEHLAAQAHQHPEIAMIGCEPYVSGVARLLTSIDAERLGNIRIVVDDARVLLAALPDASIERVFVLFPDPWPKTRHHKRRIVNPVTAAEFARVLAPGGELRLATDDMSYARAMLMSISGDRFHWLAERPGDWRARPADWPASRYEQKALAAGRACVFLRYRRRPAAGLAVG